MVSLLVAKQYYLLQVQGRSIEPHFTLHLVSLPHQACPHISDVANQGPAGHCTCQYLTTVVLQYNHVLLVCLYGPNAVLKGTQKLQCMLQLLPRVRIQDEIP